MHNPHNDTDPPEPYGDWQKTCVLCKTNPVAPEDAREGFNVCPTCADKERRYSAMLWDLQHEDPSGEMFGWAVL